MGSEEAEEAGRRHRPPYHRPHCHGRAGDAAGIGVFGTIRFRGYCEISWLPDRVTCGGQGRSFCVAEKGMERKKRVDQPAKKDVGVRRTTYLKLRSTTHEAGVKGWRPMTKRVGGVWWGAERVWFYSYQISTYLSIVNTTMTNRINMHSVPVRSNITSRLTTRTPSPIPHAVTDRKDILRRQL